MTPLQLIVKLNTLICKAETHIRIARAVEETLVREADVNEGATRFSYTPEEATEAVKTALHKAKAALEEVLQEETKPI